MQRTLIPTLKRAQRETTIALGTRGALPAGRDIALEDRTRAGLSDPARWQEYVKGFKQLRCKVRGVYLGNNGPYATTPLFALEVMPMQRLPTTQAGNTATPYHISIAFYDRAQRRDFEELQRRFARPREVTLRGEINGNAFFLDENRCPIGSDPLIRRVHQNGHDSFKRLHVSL